MKPIYSILFVFYSTYISSSCITFVSGRQKDCGAALGIVPHIEKTVELPKTEHAPIPQELSREQILRGTSPVPIAIPDVSDTGLSGWKAKYANYERKVQMKSQKEKQNNREFSGIGNRKHSTPEKVVIVMFQRIVR